MLPGWWCMSGAQSIKTGPPPPPPRRVWAERLLARTQYSLTRLSQLLQACTLWLLCLSSVMVQGFQLQMQTIPSQYCFLNYVPSRSTTQKYLSTWRLRGLGVPQQARVLAKGPERSEFYVIGTHENLVNTPVTSALRGAETGGLLGLTRSQPNSRSSERPCLKGIM